MAKRVASRWAFALASGDFRPPIPRGHLVRFAYVPETPDLQALDSARDSVNVFLPKFIELLRKTMGDRYYITVSEGRGKLFYFFSPKQPVDTFSLTLWIRGGRAYLDLGFTPYDLKGEPDFRNMKNERVMADPSMAGLAFMRTVRKLLPTITSSSTV